MLVAKIKISIRIISIVKKESNTKLSRLKFLINCSEDFVHVMAF